MWKWWHGIISGEVPTQINPEVSSLVEASIQDRTCTLTKQGAISVKTERRISSDSWYVVEDQFSQKIIDWQHINRINTETFLSLKIEFQKKISILKPHVTIVERSVCAEDSYGMGIHFITTSAVHALFSTIIFRDPRRNHPLGEFTIYHDPDFKLPGNLTGLKSEQVLAVDFGMKEIIILGSSCLGDIKNAVFSVLMTLLPEHDVLPLRANAVLDSRKNVSLFLGPPEAGKTTLSFDSGLKLIGDEEIGLGKGGVFNIGGGYYERWNGPTMNSVLQVNRASQMFGSLLENVPIGPITKEPLFSEEGRSAFPVSHIEESVLDGRGELPNNIFLLYPDISGVLPAISKLTPEKASELLSTNAFVSTEIPFLRDAAQNAELLISLIDRFPMKIWLVNTGWYGGMRGVGRRYPIAFTRQCIRAIQDGMGEDVTFVRDENFSMDIPLGLKHVDVSLLFPKSLWSDKEAYDLMALTLRHKIYPEQKGYLTNNQRELWRDYDQA
jgi:phosphoenolpyruvate carboxykinase (ATP)